jgi:vacuolar-type H+-ATPase subunit I/STV1
MKHDYGRWLVGLVGVIVIIVGLAMVVEGVRRKFEKELRLDDLHGPTRTVVLRLGMVGTIARGIVFAVAGGLVVNAAVSYDASKSTGLDGALRTLADRAYGQWLLGLIALGLIAFGIYGFAAARWAKT